MSAIATLKIFFQAIQILEKNLFFVICNPIPKGYPFCSITDRLHSIELDSINLQNHI